MIARADSVPGFNPPGEHPVAIIAVQNSVAQIAWITHHRDAYRLFIPLTASLIPSAFAGQNPPLTDDTSVLGLIDHQGIAMIVTAAIRHDTLFVGTAPVLIHRRRVLASGEFTTLLTLVRAGLATRRRS